MIVFRTLGGLEVGPGTSRRPLSSQVRGLICALLLAGEGRVVAADRIMYAAWPDEAPDVVRNRLWFHISRLRSELDDVDLGDRLETHPSGYRIVLEPTELDAAVFVAEADLGRSLLESDPAAAVERLTAALGMWRGDAFGDAGGHPALSADVVRLEERRLAAGEDLADGLIAMGEFVDAVAHLEAMLRLDPYRERLVSQLMHALFAAGRQAEALRTYDRALSLLRDELGVDPSPLLRSMAQRVLRHDPTLAGASAGAAPTIVGSDADGAFVERSRIVRRLVGGDGRPQRGVTLLAGEAGAGKTALLARAAARCAAAERRLLVVAGACPAGLAGKDAFGPFRQALDALVGDLETSVVPSLQNQQHVETLWAASTSSLEVVVDAGPDLIGTLVDVANVQARALRSDWERGRALGLGSERRPRIAQQSGLLRTVLAVLGQLAKRSPLLLVFDDLHRADDATIEALSALAEADHDGRLSVMGAFRSDAPLGPGWPRLRAALEAHHNGGLIDLDSISRDDRLAFVNAIVDREPNELDATFRERLLDVTGGRPLFVVEWLRAIVERGAVARDPAGRLVQVAEFEIDDWPSQIEAVLEERFARYSADDMELLRAAAVEGDPFTADAVAAATGRELGDVVRFMSRGDASGHHVVAAEAPARIGPRRVLRYRFRHQLFRRYLYRTLDRAERSLLHGAVAAALEDLGGDVDDVWAAALGSHFADAGMGDRAVRHLRRAASRLMRQADNVAAADVLQRALVLAEELPRDTSRLVRGDLHLNLGVARLAIEGFTSPGVENDFMTALELLSDDPGWVDPIRALFGMWVVNLSRGSFRRSAPFVDRMEAVRPPGTSSDMIVLHARWSQHVFGGDVPSALRSTELGRDAYRHREHHPLTYLYGNHDPGVCARSLGALAQVLAGRIDSARQWIADAGGLADSLGHPPSSSQARALGMLIEHLAGNHETVLDLGEAPWDPVAPVWDVLAEGLILDARVSLGEPSATGDLLHVVDRQLDMGDALFACLTASSAALSLLRAGDLERAQHVLARPRVLLENVDLHFYAAEMVRIEALIAAEAGEVDRAIRLTERSRAVATQQGAVLFQVAADSELAGFST